VLFRLPRRVLLCSAVQINLTILDPSIAAQVEQHFQEDLRTAKRITHEQLKERPLHLRLLHRLSYYIMRYY
jgi:phosphatidylserine/phosphatidylglycerophosphate/cardiolipin synthase-like enzyme